MAAAKARAASSLTVKMVGPEPYDLTTRQATAELIDEFSQGITLVSYEQRVAQELVSLIAVPTPNGPRYHEPKDLVWSKLSYVLGVVHPSVTAFPPEGELVIQKSFFDHMWQIPLVKVLSYLEDGADFPPEKFGETAGKLNELNRSHQDEVKNFKQVYLDEIRGALSLYMHVPRMCPACGRKMNMRGYRAFRLRARTMKGRSVKRNGIQYSAT